MKIPVKDTPIETFVAAGGHSPEIRERRCGVCETVAPLRMYLDGDVLVTEYEIITGPNKGKKIETRTRKQ